MPWTSQALLALAATVATFAPAMAAERTWTSATGGYKVTGEFVRLHDGTVDIRTHDGRLVRITLAELSKADRNSLPKSDGGPDTVKPEKATNSSVAQPPIPKPKPASADDGGGSKQVIAEGSGLNKEDAVKDACRSAIRQVVGEVVDADTIVQNNRLIKDEVLIYSDGLVDRHEITDEQMEGGIVRVTIQATVKRRKLVEKLVAAKITVKELDDTGEDVVGRILSEREAREAATAMVAKAIVGFPGDQLEARILEWKPINDDNDYITLGIKVEIAPSIEAYKAFQQRLCLRLGDLAKADGEFTTTMPSHKPWDQDPCKLPYIGQNNYFSEQLPKLMPAVEDVQSTNDGRPKDLVAIAVATLVSADSTRIDWRYFVLDGKAGTAVVAAARRPASCKLTFENAAGEPVAVDRFDPVHDAFPTFGNNTVNSGARIPWNKYLAKIWLVETRPYARRGNSFFSELNEFEPNEAPREVSPQPAVVFVGPMFFGSGWNDNLMYVPKVTLSRHVRLTEEEVRPIKRVRCELTFRKPQSKD